MPMYDYLCSSCKLIEEHIHNISEKPEIKCPKCKRVMDKIISFNAGGFIIKGGTPAIHYREKRQRTKNTEKMREKQKKSWGDSGPKIQPNIAGVPMDSWSDAQRLAKEAGMNHESYTPYVEKENKKKIIV